MLYFAYGMNTNPDYMRDLRYVGLARLWGYQLTFRGGVANVEPLPRVQEADARQPGYVTGALWQLDTRALEWLDRREGFPHFYLRHPMTVDVLNDAGERDYVTTALVYQMAEPLMRPERLGGLYERVVREGYAQLGIPEAQLDLALEGADR